MKLEIAEKYIAEFIQHLRPDPSDNSVIKRLLVCGSIRRRSPEVNDGDIVILPENVNQLGFLLHDLSIKRHITILKDGPAIKRIALRPTANSQQPTANGLGIDIYIATAATWGTIKRIALRPTANSQQPTANGLEIDIYIATAATWGTLTLIRTGSKEHNIRLAIFAKNKGYKLKADGSGLIKISSAEDGRTYSDKHKQDIGTLVSVNHEQDIFTILGLPYTSPEART